MKSVNIDGYRDRYKVTEDGKIWSIYSNKWIKYQKHYKGYWHCKLFARNKAKSIMVHRVVALTYVKNPGCYKEINHKDCNKLNNHYSNLEWCTRKQNMRHAYKHNLVPVFKGEKHGNAKLTDDQAREIKQRYKTEEIYQRDLAKEYGVTQRVIWNIVNEVGWKHI